jgi:hypothetical protein
MNNTFPVVLICRNSNGSPTSYAANIMCTMEEHDEVEYMEALCEKAEEDGYVIDNEVPVIANPGDPLWEPFTYVYDDEDWKNAPVITLSNPQH